MALDKNLLNDYNPKLISDATGHFQNNSKGLENFLSNIDINNIDELSKIQLYYDGHQKCADALQSALLDDKMFFNTTFAVRAIEELSKIPNNRINIPNVDFERAIEDISECLQELGNAQDDVIRSANQYRDYKTSAGDVINNLNAYQKQLKNVYNKLRGIVPLFKDDFGIFRNFVQSNKRADVRRVAHSSELIEGQIDANILKKNICDNFGLDPKKSSVKTFVDNLAKADKLLNDENIKNICNTKDTVGSEVIQKILKVYTTLVKVINDQTLTKQIVDGSADGLKKYVNLANKIICQHAIWRIEQGDLRGARDFINDIQKKHVELADKIGARRLNELAQNPIGSSGHKDFNKLDDNEVLEMWQDAIKHGFKLETNGLMSPTNIDKTFFAYGGKYYAKIKNEFFQWDSGNKKFVPSNDPTSSSYTTRSAQDLQAPSASSDSVAIIQGEAADGGDKVHLFIYDKTVVSKLKNAGLAKIGKLKQINNKKYICVNDADYRHILPKLRQNGALNAHIDSFTQKSLDRNEFEKRELTENSVVASARLRLSNDKSFQNSISQLSKGGYNIVFYDIETTGNKPADKTTDIVQIGAIKYKVTVGSDGQLKFTKNGEFNKYIRPDHASSKGALRSHGLTEEYLAKHGIDKNVAISEFLNFARGQTYIMGFNNHNFDDVILSIESLDFFENVSSFKTLDFRELASLNYNASNHRSRGTLEDIFNALHSATGDDWVKEEHNALKDAEMVADSLRMLINQLNGPAKAAATTSDQGSDPQRKFKVQQAWSNSKKHIVEFTAASHKYKLNMGSNLLDVDTSVTSFISQFLPRSYDEKQFNRKMGKVSGELQDIYDKLANAIVARMRQIDPSAEIPDFVANRSEPFKYIDACFNWANNNGIDTTTLNERYVKLCARLNEMKPAETDASKWGTTTHEFIQAIEYYFATSGGNSFGSLAKRITNLYKHWKDGKMTSADNKLLEAIKNSKRLPEESKNTLESLENCISKINSGALENWLYARNKMNISDSQKVKLPLNKQQENHFVAEIHVAGKAPQYVGASVDLIFENYQNGRMMLIDLKATRGSNAQSYGAQVSLYKQIIAASEHISEGMIDANVVYLPKVSDNRVVFDGTEMSNERFRSDKMIANVKHEFTGMELGELAEASLDRIDPGWKANIAGMSQKEIEDSVEKFFYHTIGGMKFSDWADALGDYIKCAFIVRSQIKSAQNTMSVADLRAIEDALGIDSDGTFDFKHIENYLSGKHKVCSLLKKYGYNGLAENFNTAAGSVDKFIHNVLETYISNSSEGTESENAFRIYLMAGSKHGSVEQIKLRQALASIIDNKYGEYIKKEQQKLQGNKARENRSALSDNAEGLLRLIRARVNQTFVNDESFLALTDEEKRNVYLKRLSEKFLNENNETFFRELADMYLSNEFNAGNNMDAETQNFVKWLRGESLQHARRDEEKKSGLKAFSNLKINIESQLKEYIKDCTSKDLVIDQLYNAAKYVAQQLEDLFERYCFVHYGESGERSDTDYEDKDARVRGMSAVYEIWRVNNDPYYVKIKDAKYAHLENDEMSDVFHKDIFRNKTSERRYTGELIMTAQELAKQIRYDLRRLTREYVSGMYEYLLAPLDTAELTDQHWNQLAKNFGANFAEMTKEYFNTNMGPDDLKDFLEYIRDLEEYIETAFGGIDRLRHNLLAQGVDYSSQNIRRIYLKRFELASSYKNSLVQQIRTYQTSTNAVMTKLAKMVSLQTTVIHGSEMTVDRIGNEQVRAEQRIMSSGVIVNIVKEISRLISLHGQKSEWSGEDKDKIAQKLRELLTAIFELRKATKQQEESMSPEAIGKSGSFKDELSAAVDEYDGDKESAFAGLGMHVEEFDGKLWRDINEILNTLVKISSGELKFVFDEDTDFKSVEHFINQFLNWQEWYGEDDGKKTSIALQLGALGGSNGEVRVTGQQVDSAFQRFYELSMTDSEKAREELSEYLDLFAEYCNILKNQGKENTFEFKDIVDALAQNGYVLLDSTYQMKYGEASHIFQSTNVPEAIELFKDMIHLRTTLIEPLSIIQGILLQTRGIVEGRGVTVNDKMRRNFNIYLLSFYKVFDNIFHKFKERRVKGTEEILSKFSEMIGLINEISINLSAPGMAAMKINKYLNLIIEMAKMLIENTMNSKEHILHSLEVYMAYSRKKLNLDTISSELMHGGNSITFYKMEMLIRDLRNASSDAPIFFSQNEFKNFETADYIFDEKTIKSLISKGIIKYDPEKFGYFLEGVRIPREMLPADLRDSTKQPVISIERGDLMGQLDINGDVNVIIKQFFEGLQQFTAKMEEIAGGAGGRSRSKGSKGASSDGEPGDVADAKKISEEGKKALDNLSSYVDLLEREKNLLREIKNLESEKTDESVDQINEKKKQLEILQGEKKEYGQIAAIVSASGEERQSLINKVAEDTKMTDDQKKKYSEKISRITSKQGDINRQDSPDKALARMYESEMREIYRTRMEADDKEFRYMQAMQKTRDPSVKAAYQALIDTQKKKKEDILEDEKRTHKRYAGIVGAADIKQSLQDEDDTNRSVKMNEILSQNPPKTYASQLEDAIKGSVRTFSLFSVVTRIMYKFMNSLRQCVNTMKELDKVQMDLRVVTGNSKEGIQELTKSYSELGFKLGLTTKEVAESANTWLRQGYSISETNKLIEATAKLSKLGMVDAASASRYLTSAIKGFHMEASEAESVVDRLVTLDMKYAASAGDIAQALARVSAVAQSSNTSLNETTAMLTTMIDVSQQGAESVGDALKTMMSRFGNVKAGAFTKLMDSEDSENLNDIERVLNSIGITVRQSTMQMKSFSSVLDELYEKWDQLSNVEQNAIATAFAGQRQRNFFLLLMQNEESYRQALETTENAQGQAAEKYLAYMESYEYAAQQVKNAWEQITQQIFESDVFINLQKGLAQLIKRLPTLTGVLSKLFAATSMYRAPTMFSNVAAKLPVLGRKDPNVSSRWTREGGINKAREYSEQNALLNIKTLVENIFRIEERKEQRETHENNVQGNTPVAATTSSQPPKTTSGASSGTQVYKQSPNKTNFALRRMRLGAANSNADRDIMAQQATYAAILSGLSTGLTGTSGFDSILSSLFSESYGDVKRTGAERVGAGVVSAVGTGVGAYFGGAAGAMAGSSIGDLINTITMGLFHYEEVQRLDRVKMANKIVDVLNSIDDSVQKATNAVSINAAERTANDWQSIYKTRDEMQLAIYQLASEDIEKNGNGAFLFLSNFLHDNVNPSLEDAIAKLDDLTGSTEKAQEAMRDFGAAYQVAKAEAEYAALESEIEEINKKLGEEKYVLGQAYLDATTAGEKSAIARRYAKRFPNSSVAQAAYAVQGEKARLRLNRENQYNTLLSAGLAASGMQQWSSYQIQNSAPDVIINNILEKAEKFLNDFGMTAKQNGVYTEEARKRAEAIVKKDEQLSNVYKQQASYYGRANRGVNRIQDALGVYNSTATVGVTMQQLKYMAKNYTAESWRNDATAKALMDSLRDTLGMSVEDVLRDIDLLADNLTGNIRKGFLLSTEAAEKFGSKLEYVTSEDALNGFDKFLEKMSDLEKLMDEITSSSGMAFESTEKVIKTYPWLLYGEDNTLGTNNITGNLIRFLGGNLSNSGDLVAQKVVGELWSGSLGESVWSEFASKVKNNEIGAGLSSGIRNIVTNSDYTTANSAFMAIMKDTNLGQDAANELNKLFEDFIKNINLTEEYTAIYLKTIEKMNKWRTKMNENEISELESIKNNLSSVNSERERELKLIKAREALENAKNEKKRVYRTGKIMPLDNYIGQRPEVVKTEVRRFNRNRNDCRILLVTIVLKLSPVCRQYTV